MKRTKVIVPIILCIALMLGVLSLGVSAAGRKNGLGNFTKNRTFSSDTFKDVSEGNWFYDNISNAYKYGLMLGNGDSTFNPYGNVTLAETITIAARMHAVFYSGKEDFKPSTPWYDTYVKYAYEHGLTETEYTDCDRAATRAEFAGILSRAVSEESLQPVNTVKDDSIPDVKMSDKYGKEIYLLYRAGILAGNDSQGTFLPQSNIRRCEVAAIVSRIVDEKLRIVNEYGKGKSGSAAEAEDHGGNVTAGGASGAAETDPQGSSGGDTPELPEDPVTKPAASDPTASDKPTLAVSSVSAKPGSKDVAVTVTVCNNPGIASLGLVISFDDALTLNRIVFNDEIGGSHMAPPAMNNPSKVIWIDPLKNADGDWVFVTLYFDVAENAEAGDHQITVTYDTDDVYNINMDNVSFNIVNGVINVIK